jgi:exosortase family protein XrtF
MKAFSFEEFKPSIFFLLKFLALYVVGSIAYGVFVQAWYPVVDPVTAWVTQQTSALLSVGGWDTSVVEPTHKATANILYEGKAILSVFEGCNGLNVMIIYVAFLVAFGPYRKALLWFIPVGLVVIHLFNLGRIYLLFFVSIKMPQFMYFTHKYFFTAVLYIVVFVLWMIWLWYFKPKKSEAVD